MRIILIVIYLLSITSTIVANKYPFDMNHQYKVEQERIAENDACFVKAWGERGNADKAIIQALQDAVACCIFMGIEVKNSTTGHNASALPPQCPEGVAMRIMV